MKIISWNCHYGFTKDKQDRIREFARKHDDADIYLIQEAKENDIINLDEFKYRHWYGDHAEFGACHKARANSGDLGIAIMSNKYEIKRIDEGIERFRYVLPYEVSCDNEKYIIFHVWSKAFPEFYSEAIVPALEYYKHQLPSENIILMGDFNFGKEFGDSLFTSFDEGLKIYNLEKPDDIIQKTNTETFSYKNKTYFDDCLYYSNTLKVIDYDVGKPDPWFHISDHCPVYAEIEIKKSQ